MTSDQTTQRAQWIAACLLLAAACLALLVLQADTPGFYGGSHGFLSSDAMSWGRNMAVGDGRGVIYEVAYLRDLGEIEYVIYHRFSHTVYWWISLLCRAMPNALAAQTMVARQLMNVSICVALCASWGALAALRVSPLAAAAAALLAFSSRYMLWYNDLIFHNSPTLAGCALLFLAIALHERGIARRWHVALAGVAAVSLGWQAFAVLGAWWVVQVASRTFASKTRSLKALSSIVLGAPSTLCLAYAVLWGMAILSYLMLSEWRFLGGRFLDCPSVQSMIYRLTGVSATPSNLDAQGLVWVSWAGFLPRQVLRILGMLTPVAPLKLTMVQALGVGVVLGAIAALWYWKRPAVTAWPVWITMVLSGPIWALVLRNYVAFHDLETIFHLGIPLVFWGLAAVWIDMRRPVRARWVAAALCLVLYVGNVAVMNNRKAQQSARANAITHEAEVMQALIPRRSAVAIDPSTEVFDLPPNAMLYYLAGRYIAEPEMAEYVVSVEPLPGADALTDNDLFNLYHLP